MRLTGADIPVAVPHDPGQGIDNDGRIPKVTAPASCENPARWRYIPEGRIKPGNIFERFLVSTFISPIFFHQQDVGTGLGIALTDIDFRTHRRQEFIGVFAARTTEGQETYKVVWQRWLNTTNGPQGGVFLEERSILKTVAAYDRTITRRFFGLGPDTPAEAESSYTDESVILGPQIQRSLPGPLNDFVSTVGVRGEHHNIARGVSSGLPSTTETWSDLTTNGDSCDGVWFTGGFRWDTRDSQHQAYSGGMVELQADGTPWNEHSAGSDRGLNGVHRGVIWTLRSTWTIQTPSFFHNGGDSYEENPPTDTVACGAFIQDTTGELPFWALPTLGGSDTLRGYIANRFTDESAWHASIEYRMWVIPRGFRIAGPMRIERVGIVPFYDCGSVAPRLADLAHSRWLDSVGVGLRFAFERTVTFRADQGFSREGSNFTFTFGAAF